MTFLIVLSISTLLFPGPESALAHNLVSIRKTGEKVENDSGQPGILYELKCADHSFREIEFWEEERLWCYSIGDDVNFCRMDRGKTDVWQKACKTRHSKK